MEMITPSIVFFLICRNGDDHTIHSFIHSMNPLRACCRSGTGDRVSHREVYKMRDGGRKGGPRSELFYKRKNFFVMRIITPFSHKQSVSTSRWACILFLYPQQPTQGLQRWVIQDSGVASNRNSVAWFNKDYWIKIGIAPRMQRIAKQSVLWEAGKRPGSDGHLSTRGLQLGLPWGSVLDDPAPTSVGVAGFCLSLQVGFCTLQGVPSRHSRQRIEFSLGQFSSK